MYIDLIYKALNKNKKKISIYIDRSNLIQNRYRNSIKRTTRNNKKIGNSDTTIHHMKKIK